MSGITGTYHLDERPSDPIPLQRMVECMAERGRDGLRIWHEGPVGLGHCMLHTTPESLFEKYPMTSRCGNFVLTADARIDNREELISILRPPKYADRPVTDGELILLAYDKWGKDCPLHLLGDFAFALWDRVARHLFCARDSMGVKPFYYYLDDRSLFFASTVSSILGVESVPRELNELTIANTFLLRIADNTSTFYSSIRRLAPAHTFTLSRTGRRLENYWSLDRHTEIRYKRDEQYEEHFREAFFRAVSARMRNANGTVASALSGGLDSSSIVSAASRLLKGAASNDVLKTYSCVFPAVSEEARSLIDESSYVRDVVSHHQIHNVCISGDALDPAREIENVLEYAAEPPFQFNLYLHLAMYRKAASDGADVFLDGIDGDSAITHGWSYVHDLARRGEWRTFCSLIRDWTDLPGSPSNHYLSETISRPYLKKRLRSGAFMEVARAARAMSDVYGLGLASVLKTKIWDEVILSGVNRRNGSREAPEPGVRLDPCLLAQIRSQTNRAGGHDAPDGVDYARHRHCQGLENPLIQIVLESSDLSAAKIGLEPRYPFFDRPLMEYAVAIPPEQKFKDGWPRSILRRSLAELLPASVANRLTKSNLGVNLREHMLLRARSEIVRYLSAHLDLLDGIIEIDSGRRAVRAFERCTAASADSRRLKEIFLLLSFTKWIQRVSVRNRTVAGVRANRFQHPVNLKPVEVCV